MTRGIRTVGLGLTAALIAGAAMAQEDVFGEAAAKLDPAIASALSCADPTGAAGTYRVVVFSQGFEHVSSQVYLQRLEWDEKATRVVRTVVVAELGSGFWSVGTPRVTSRETCTFEVPATHTYSSEAARFTVVPTGAGAYSFRKLAPK